MFSDSALMTEYAGYVTHFYKWTFFTFRHVEIWGGETLSEELLGIPKQIEYHLVVSVRQSVRY